MFTACVVYDVARNIIIPNRHHHHLQFNTSVTQTARTSVRGQAFVHTAWPIWAGQLLPDSNISGQPTFSYIPFGESSHLIHHRDIDTSFGARMPFLTPLAVLIPASFRGGEFAPRISNSPRKTCTQNTKI